MARLLALTAVVASCGEAQFVSPSSGSFASQAAMNPGSTQVPASLMSACQMSPFAAYCASYMPSMWSTFGQPMQNAMIQKQTGLGVCADSSCSAQLGAYGLGSCNPQRGATTCQGGSMMGIPPTMGQCVCTSGLCMSGKCGVSGMMSSATGALSSLLSSSGNGGAANAVNSLGSMASGFLGGSQPASGATGGTGSLFGNLAGMLGGGGSPAPAPNWGAAWGGSAAPAPNWAAWGGAPATAPAPANWGFGRLYDATEPTSEPVEPERHLGLMMMMLSFNLFALVSLVVVGVKAVRRVLRPHAYNEVASNEEALVSEEGATAE